MGTPPDRATVTQLLRQWGSGNKTALDRLMRAVYDQLHKLASRCLLAEKPEHTLRATALVHEAYLRLAGVLVDVDVAWQDRVHFFPVYALILRRIRVDHAKASNRQERGARVEKSLSGRSHDCWSAYLQWNIGTE